MTTSKKTYFKSNEFYNWVSGEAESPIYKGTGTRVVKTLAFNGKNYQFGNDSAQTFQVNRNFNERIDEVHAGGGDDRLYDFTTDNGVKLFGGAGDDYIQGGDGDNVIDGGTGVNRLNGYGGNDTFVFNDQGGVNVVEDFNSYDSDEKDKIQLNPDGNQKYNVVRMKAGGAQIINKETSSIMTVKHETDMMDIITAMGATGVFNSNARFTHFEDAAGNEITVL